MKRRKSLYWIAVNFSTFSMISVMFAMFYLCGVLFLCTLRDSLSEKVKGLWERKRLNRAPGLIHKRKHCGLHRHGQN